MSNGHVCCILGVCCQPPGGAAAKQALAEEIAEVFGWSAEKTEEKTGNAYAVASWLLDNFDLVPKGVGAQIVRAYRPMFQQVAEKGITWENVDG